MAKSGRKKRKEERNRAPRDRHAGGEDRRSEAVTVAWMLGTVATLLAEMIALTAFWYFQAWPVAADRPAMLPAVVPLMLLTSCVTGIFVLCLTPLVYLFRRVPPPVPVSVAAVAIGVSPIVVVVVLASRST